jgi:PAS domain S-box-containing protein
MHKTLFDDSPEPAYLMDPEQNRILAANDAGCMLLGYTREELLVTPISHIHPAELAELSELLERVLKHGRASTIKLTCRTKLGTFLPTEISLHALEVDGRVRILGLIQDRSEHRERLPARLRCHTALAQLPLRSSARRTAEKGAIDGDDRPDRAARAETGHEGRSHEVSR